MPDTHVAPVQPSPPRELLRRLSNPVLPTPADPLVVQRRFVAGMVSDDAPDLSQRQLAVLLTVYTTDEAQTVRGLAAALNVSKPAITRALDRLQELDLARREPDRDDLRSLFVRRTVAGDAYVRRLRAALDQAQAEG